MSSISLGRIKQIRPKENGQFLNNIPIGTDGLLVDMLSGLDLEEQLRLGNDHYVEIQEVDEDTTNIKEWYFTEKKGNRTIAQMSSLITYSTQIIITDSNITITLYKGDLPAQKETKIPLHTKNIAITEDTTLTTIDEGVD